MLSIPVLFCCSHKKPPKRLYKCFGGFAFDLTEISVQIEVGVQVFAGIIAHLSEQFFALLHGQAAAQGLDADAHGVRKVQNPGVGANRVFKVGLGCGILIDPLADGSIAVGSFQIQVIQSNLARKAFGNSQIRHEDPGPLLGAAANIGDLNVFLYI